MKISVIIPTYRRANLLISCLKGLKKQFRLADEIIVIAREDDDQTLKTLRKITIPNLTFYTIKSPGQVDALNMGIRKTTGQIIAITDDDSIPEDDWLEKIESSFQANKNLGVLGGRDRIFINNKEIKPLKNIVGKFQWHGRIIGNHHLGIGSVREVDFVKGVNMSFRAKAAKEVFFDQRLKGNGAQVCSEILFCSQVKKRGWKIFYDPNLLVNHYPGLRFDEDQRNKINTIANKNRIHNETLATLDFLKNYQKPIFLLWFLLIGTKASPGLFFYFLSDIKFPLEATRESFSSKLKGLKSYFRKNNANKKQTKILFIDHTAEMGGAEYSLLAIAKKYPLSTVLTLSKGSLVKIFKKNHINTIVIEIPEKIKKISRKSYWSPAEFILYPKLIFIVLQIAFISKKYDLIYANSQKSFIMASLAAKITRKPIIWHLRDILSEEHFSKRNIKLMINLANKFADKVIANSSATAKAFIKQGGKEKLVEVVYSGIDLKPFLSSQNKNRELLKELNLRNNPVVGAFSRLARWKGQHILIEALTFLPNVHAIILGGPLFGSRNYEERIKKLARELDLSDRVHFLGHQENIPAYMAICDIVIHTSITPEPFGRIIVEGMLSKKPIIATNLGGVTEIIDQNLNGILIEPNDPKLLADKIQYLLENKKIAQEISNKGYQKAISNFTSESTNRTIDKIVNSLM